MPDYDLAVRGGTVVTASDTIRADIGIRDGRIVSVAERVEGAAREIDASGLLVLPGGIDSHVHIAQDSGPGIVMADDFASATRAAAAGGNTCVMPFAMQKKGESLRGAVEAYRALADGQCHIDVSFHLIISDPTPAVLGQELPALVRDGYTSFKVFMTYDDLVLSDRQLLDVFDVARRERALVMVHAEGYDSIRYMTERLVAAGTTAPIGHALSRPEIVEREAAHRAISHAELIDVPIMIVHVSGREAAEQIRWAQARGLKVYAETCPQYITLTAADLEVGDFANGDFEGSKYVCSPPPRDKASQAAIWEGIEQGLFQTFSSDHCPFRFDDPQGKTNPRGRTSFRWVPNGIPGIETRLPILFSEGVSSGRISLQRFVALTATNHAKLYGLYPRKGSIGVGFDADLTLWDPNRKETIRQASLHHGPDYTPWEGFAVTGWPVMTIAGGTVVCEEGRVAEGEAPSGRILQRDISPYAAGGSGSVWPGCSRHAETEGRFTLASRHVRSGLDLRPNESTKAIKMRVFKCTIFAAACLAAILGGSAPSRADGPIAQLGPRPFYLVDSMKPGPVRDRLAACGTDRTYTPRLFSISHRGAPLQFPEHTREGGLAAARMGAGIIECDVAFTRDRQLVCRHAQCDLHTTTDILKRPELAAKCTQGFQPADPATGRKASAKCCTSDLTLAEFKSLNGKMDAADPSATTLDGYMNATPRWRTDLYATTGTLMSHKEYIALVRSLGRKFTPELKAPEVPMPFEGTYTQDMYADQMLAEYKDAGVPAADVFPQSFQLRDILHWIATDAAFGRQAVFLDGRDESDKTFDATKPETWTPSMPELVRQGVQILAPPLWMLVRTGEDGAIKPSVYAEEARKAGLKLIGWSLDRSGPLKSGGGYYYQSVKAITDRDGDTMSLLDVLHRDVGVLGVFSDWPATTTFYANCMGIP